jgi:hypothetical protein
MKIISNNLNQLGIILIVAVGAMVGPSEDQPAKELGEYDLEASGLPPVAFVSNIPSDSYGSLVTMVPPDPMDPSHPDHPKHERSWSTALQVAVPFFIAGAGTIGAGLMLGKVEVSRSGVSELSC